MITVFVLGVLRKLTVTVSINMYLRAFLENCAIATDHQTGLECAPD